MVLNQKLLQKEKALQTYLAQYKKIIISYSGGVDSTVLAFYANKVLKKNALIAIGDSPSLARDDLKSAIQLAQDNAFHLKKIYPQEFKNLDYLANNSNRCYFCKKDLFSELNALKLKEKAEVIMDGTNYDDLSDTRPGLKAAQEKKIHHPLVAVKLTKKEIRLLANKNHLPNHDKPASPCLASRIPHGLAVTLEKIKKVEQAEKYLKDNFAISPIRVRYQYGSAKIQTSKENLLILLQESEKIIAYFTSIGFNDTCLDLQELLRK